MKYLRLYLPLPILLAAVFYRPEELRYYATSDREVWKVNENAYAARVLGAVVLVVVLNIPSWIDRAKGREIKST